MTKRILYKFYCTNDEAVNAKASNPYEVIIVMLNLLNFKDEEEASKTIAVKKVLKLLEVNGTRLGHAVKAA